VGMTASPTRFSSAVVGGRLVWSPSFLPDPSEGAVLVV
jgi:hypothetical protein